MIAERVSHQSNKGIALKSRRAVPAPSYRQYLSEELLIVGCDFVLSFEATDHIAVKHSMSPNAKRISVVEPVESSLTRH